MKPVGMIAEGVYGHNSAGHAAGQTKRGLKKYTETVVGAPAQVRKKAAIVLEVYPEHNRDREHSKRLKPEQVYRTIGAVKLSVLSGSAALTMNEEWKEEDNE